MEPIHIFFIIGTIMAGLLIFVFMLPTEVERKKKQKKQAEVINVQREQALEKQIRHLENTIPALRKQLDTHQQKEHQWQKELLIERTKVEKLEQKLNQERDWQQKEVEKFDKKVKEVAQFKNELSKLQESFNKEHSRNLHLENELRDLKEKGAVVGSERRELDLANVQLKSKLEAAQREIEQLKKDIEFASRQKEDTSWVTKSEYLKLEKKCKDVEGKLEQMTKAARKSSTPESS